MIPAEYHRIVIGITLLALVVSLFRRGNRAGLSFFIAAMVLVVSGVITTDDFLRGFGNRQIAIIFVLIFISGALRDHFNLLKLLDRPFRSVKTSQGMLLRMTGIVAFFSSLLNNTPVVALMIPYVTDWSKRKGVSPSKLLIPLS